jgi:23S rRNA pseudoU1915 N3-methylase RlmH
VNSFVLGLIKLLLLLIVNEEAWEGVEEFRIGERVDSDHLPLEINVEEPNYEERGKLRAKEEQKRMTIKIWDDQGVGEYRRRLEKTKFEEQEIEKMAVELKEVIEKARTKNNVIVNGAKGIRKKCEQLKKEAVKALREWKRTKITRNGFVEAKGREITEKERGGG